MRPSRMMTAWSMPWPGGLEIISEGSPPAEWPGGWTGITELPFEWREMAAGGDIRRPKLTKM